MCVSSRCDPQEATNCKEEAQKGQKTGVCSSALLLQLRWTSIEKWRKYTQECTQVWTDVEEVKELGNKSDLGCAKCVQFILRAHNHTIHGLDYRYQKRCCWITWKLKLKYHIAAKGSVRSFVQINWVRRDLTEVLSHWLNMDCLDWAFPYVYFSLKRKPWKGEQKCLFQKSKMSQSTEADHFLTNMHKHWYKCNIYNSKTRVFTFSILMQAYTTIIRHVLDQSFNPSGYRYKQYIRVQRAQVFVFFCVHVLHFCFCK